jgi:two-component system, cell cycle sensor histidine kinase and response regulator CckA
MKQGLRTPGNGGASEGEIRNFVLLLVEDDDGDADLVRELLEHVDQVAYEVVHVRTLREALATLPARPVDVVLLDLRLADADGVDAVRAVRAAAGSVPIVVLTGADEDDLAFDCLEAGAQDFLLKSELRGLTLRRSIHYAISRLREHRLREFLNLRVNHIVASSPATLYSTLIDEGRLRHEWVSPNVERLTGYRPDEIARDNWWKDHIHPADREAVIRKARLLFTVGALKQEYRVRRRDGSYLWISDEQRLLHDAEGKPFQVVGSWTDISERHAAAALLAESEERYRRLFEDNPHPMWVFDPQSLAFLEVNDAALRLFGFSRQEMLAMKVDALYPVAEELEAKDSPLSGQTGSRWLHRSRRKDGSQADIETATQAVQHGGEPARLVVATDVSEQRRLELQLLQSQKMEAIGQLAGGVAHDFNNLLGVIAGYCELLGNDITGSRARHRLEEITDATERAAALTRQLLAFGRKQMLQPKVFDLDRVVQEIARLLGRLIGENIEIVTRSSVVLGRVYADPGQIEQVIVNLALNARDAMPGGGRLILETRETYLDEAYARERPGVRPGPHLLLLVADNGSGMAPAIQAQIFEPFFTTKEAGKGTGLGLSMAYGIIQQSGGHIGVQSEPGRGTTFRIYLPKVDGEPDSEPEREPPARDARGGDETILLLEDSEPLRLILKEMLEDAGYKVLDGSTLEEAMAFSVHPGPIHLVLSDVVMPGASGPEVVAFLRTQRPDIQAIFMSGYPDEAIGKHGVLDRGIHFLQKPFSSQALRSKLRDVLDSYG